MSPDRLRPGDIAAAAGINISSVGLEGDLDQLAEDHSGQVAENVISGEVNALQSRGEGPNIIPPLGEGHSTGSEIITEGRSEYRNSVIAERIVAEVDEGNLESSLSRLSDITDSRVVNLLMPRLSQSIHKYVERLMKDKAGEPLISTLAFERARARAGAISSDDKVKSMVMEAIDVGEASAILASNYEMTMKAILALRLSGREQRITCLADVCAAGIKENDVRTEADWQPIERILNGLKTDSDVVEQTKRYFTAYQYLSASNRNAPKYEARVIRNQILSALRSTRDI